MVNWLAKMLYYSVVGSAVGYILTVLIMQPGSFSLGIYPLFAVILLPLVNLLYNTISDDSHSRFDSNLFINICIVGFVALITLGFYVSGFSNPIIYIALYTGVSLYFKLDTRYVFGGALVIFCFVALSLILDSNMYAESLSVLAYYLLVAGVLLQIVESIRDSKNTDTANQNYQTTPYIYTYDVNTLVSVSSGALSILLLEAFVLQSVEFAWIVVIVFYVVFMISKFIGYNIDYTVTRYKPSDITALRVFALSYALFMILYSLLLNGSGIGTVAFGIYHLVVSIVFILGGLVVFFDIPFLDYKKLGVYKSASLLVIVALVAILVYNILFAIPRVAAPEFADDSSLTDVTTEPVQIVDEEIIADQLPGDTVFESVGENYSLTPGLSVGSSGDGVRDLQEVLARAGYYEGEINGTFDEVLRQSLIRALIETCDWPETTQGVFGPQSKECIDTMQIPVVARFDN
ncbi:peptidoglycan-binding protein [Candidatus Gracilibacteria bacterium]|nr:peptidoglycan-binding protein [Candidatus Gracilibacteria bacterium]